MINPPCDLAIFGATGDLAVRKLFPAIYQLNRGELLNDDSRILALGRNEYDLNAFKEHLVLQLKKHIPAQEIDKTALANFCEKLHYLSLDFCAAEGYQQLARYLNHSSRRFIAYLATPTAIFNNICDHLASNACINDKSRIVLEKPIGYDLNSSKQVNDHVARYFQEQQIYRIDHYLGKETVQNLLALRFANNLFESQWNNRHVDYIEITVAEKVGIEGRWNYFDKAGQLRDMVQNHLLQLLCLIAMDPPADLSADSIQTEKLKILKALQAIYPDKMNSSVVRGQYTSGAVDGQPVPGYLEEADANRESHTESFIAIKAEVQNWRWAGVPFYLRTGKRMPEKLSQIIIHFKKQPHYIFNPDQQDIANNKLFIRLQPDEGISLQILSKDPGLDKGMQLRASPLQLNFSDTFKMARTPDAYERLLMEIMQGKQYLFVSREEIEYAWSWCDQIISQWQDLHTLPQKYPAGSWGPVSSISLITRDGKSWYEETI